MSSEKVLNMSSIYIIRHGQASFSRSDYDQLSELGANQSAALGEALQKRNQLPTMIFGGTMKRHRETAQYCLTGLNLQMDYQVLDAWNEYDHQELIAKHNPELSNFEALTKYVTNSERPLVALQQLLEAAIQDWMEQKHDYKESWKSFNERVFDGLTKATEQVEKGQTAFVFTSGGPISIVMMKLLDLKDDRFMSLQSGIINASITKLKIRKSGPVLSTFNEYSHLEYQSDLITYR